MRCEPTQHRLSEIQGFDKIDDKPLGEADVYLHFFLLFFDWYVTHYDGDDMFFGYVSNNAQPEASEFGYIPFSELKKLNCMGIEVECEIRDAWKVRPTKEVDNIRDTATWLPVFQSKNL